MFLFVKRDFTAAYKQTLLGPLWHFIKPILTTVVSFILFNVVAKIDTGPMNPLLFQMSGIIIWNYFVSCFTNTSNTFISNAGIFGKVYFPRLVTPISVVLSQLIQFGIQLLLLLCGIFFFYLRGDAFTANQNWLAVPFMVLLMAGISLGFGIIISSITTKYRDLMVLITFGIQLLMYASAVNYPLSALQHLGDRYAWLYHFVRWNPLAAVIESFRNAMLNAPVDYQWLLYAMVWMIVLLAAGVTLFSRVEKTFMDTV